MVLFTRSTKIAQYYHLLLNKITVPCQKWCMKPCESCDCMKCWSMIHSYPGSSSYTKLWAKWKVLECRDTEKPFIPPYPKADGISFPNCNIMITSPQVILVDSKAAIQAVSSNSQPKSKKTEDIKLALKHLQAFKKMVIFQWVPSRVTLDGKERADKPAKKGTAVHAKESPLQADPLKKLLNCKVAIQCKQEADELATTKKWRDIHKIWATYKDERRNEAIPNCRLKTGWTA